MIRSYEDSKVIINSVISKFKLLNYTQIGDLRSDGYIVYSKSVNSFDDTKGKKFTSYLYSKMYYHVLDYLKYCRKLNKRECELESYYDIEDSPIAYDIEETTDDVILKEILKQLTPKQYNIIKLRYIDGVSVKDIAKIYNTSQQNISKIIKTLQLKYKED